MGELLLPAVFWETKEEEKPQDALCTVEDGEVLYITRADGFALRLLVHEVVALAQFVADEVEAFEEEDACNSACYCEEEESDQEDCDQLGPVLAGENEGHLTG